ncbi:DUF1330 domain-containing protein [Sandaracinobacteroides saxicola]|uniref:DUF1330 domain-containing protein n=1 Tax=Sandaracinobacteroides saxicola TaxID=2759707 RepID=A0A7G5IJA2_9SPHN|nr:DUF1330 domain-containing protein [Sandaracinobacteroides saxicola]QMW23444.1 DUF1330 domain-containing protein [Sandaracinobacteroides saxicola]
MRAALLALLLATPLAAQPVAAPTAAPTSPVAAPGSPPPPLDPTVCDNKPVIMLVRGLLKDRARLAQYAAAIRASGLYPKLGAYYLNNPRSVATFEGTPADNDSVLMVRFPCFAHARAFWYSELYQKQIIPVRQNPSAGDFTVTVYPELPLPDYMKGRVADGAYAAPADPSVAASIPRIPEPPK